MNATMKMPETRPAEQITLYYREGTSDKVYQASIESQGDGFVVNFAFGRRGSTLQTGTKTSAPVGHDDARRIFSRLVQEKQAKGYTEGENGVPYQHPENPRQVSGLQPQLLNPAEESEVERLLHDDAWCMQEKKDGQRLLLRKQGGRIEGINRKGLLVGLAVPIVKNAGDLPGDFTLDGECVGDTLHAFDLLHLNGEDYGPLPYQQRYLALANLLPADWQVCIELLPVCVGSQAKASRFKSLQEARAEGVVFKQLAAPYTPGKPASGGTQLKHKFYATASFLVTGLNPQRSVSLRLFEKAGACGNVTIPPNQPVPRVGSVVEVRYLYAFKESGCLFQPVYLGERDDLDPGDCSVSQLKYKAGEETAAA